MTKPNLIDAVAASTKLKKKDAAEAVDAVFDILTRQLSRGDKIQIVGFGSFELRTRKARTGSNPRTQEKIKIAASRSVAFKAGKQLKAAVNEKKRARA